MFELNKKNSDIADMHIPEYQRWMNSGHFKEEPPGVFFSLSQSKITFGETTISSSIREHHFLLSRISRGFFTKKLKYSPHCALSQSRCQQIFSKIEIMLRLALQFLSWGHVLIQDEIKISQTFSCSISLWGLSDLLKAHLIGLPFKVRWERI